MSSRDSVTFSPPAVREGWFFLFTVETQESARYYANSLSRYFHVPALIFTTPHGRWQVTNHQRNAHPDAILVETVDQVGAYA